MTKTNYFVHRFLESRAGTHISKIEISYCLWALNKCVEQNISVLRLPLLSAIGKLPLLSATQSVSRGWWNRPNITKPQHVSIPAFLFTRTVLETGFYLLNVCYRLYVSERRLLCICLQSTEAESFVCYAIGSQSKMFLDSCLASSSLISEISESYCVWLYLFLLFVILVPIFLLDQFLHYLLISGRRHCYHLKTSCVFKKPLFADMVVMHFKTVRRLKKLHI